MKAFTTISTALALLIAGAHSAPAPADVEARQQFRAFITFQGVDPNDSFTQSFPTDNSRQLITNPLSVSSIRSVGGGFCSFRGVDGSITVVADGGKDHPVSPPQRQIEGTCDPL